MQLTDAGIETIKITPPALVTAAVTLFGMTPEQWVTTLTILYLLTLLAERAVKGIRVIRARRARRSQ